MTIAVGMLSVGGYVLAADSQETAGSFKNDARKIFTAHDGTKACAIAGAGYAGYIDAIGGELADIFRLPDTTIHNWPEKVQRQLGRFYRKHVIPFGPHASELDFSLLITAQTHEGASLLMTNKTTAVHGPVAMAIGYGESTAKNLLAHVGNVILDARSAALLAAYVVYRVKQSVDTCGHYTQVVVVQGGRAKEIDWEATVEWDVLFRKYDAAAARFLWDTLRSHRFLCADDDRQRGLKLDLKHLVEATMSEIGDDAFTPVLPASDSSDQPAPKSPTRGRKGQRP